MTARFNLYDFQAYLLPGFLTLSLVALLFQEDLFPAGSTWKSGLKDVSLFLAVVLFVLSYGAGHAINALRGRLFSDLRKGPRLSLWYCIGWAMSLLRSKAIAQLASTGSYGLDLLREPSQPSEHAGLSDWQLLPEGLRHRVLEALARRSGLGVDRNDASDRDLAATWWFARTCTDVARVSERCEVYNSLAAMIRNTVLGIHMAAPLVFVISLFRIAGLVETWVAGDSVDFQTVVNKLAAFGVVLGVWSLFWQTLHQKQLFEILFAREVLLVFAALETAGESSD